MTKHTPVILTVVLSVLAIVGWTLHWHLTINNVHQASAAPKPSGVVTVPQCAEIKTGMAEDQVVAVLGLPQGDSNSNGSSDLGLYYPLQEDGSRDCNIDFNDGNPNKVDSVTLDLTTSAWNQ